MLFQVAQWIKEAMPNIVSADEMAKLVHNQCHALRIMPTREMVVVISVVQQMIDNQKCCVKQEERERDDVPRTPRTISKRGPRRKKLL